MFFNKIDATVDQSLSQRNKERTVFLKSFLNLVLKYDHIVLFSHVSPDGDSLGSLFGFQEIIRSNFLHKKVYIVGGSDGMYPWMPMRFDNFLNYSFDFSNALAVVFDVGQSSRIQRFDKFFKNSQIKFGSVVRIDHHGTPCDFHVDLTWDDPTYAATCCQVVLISDFYGWKINSKAATFLYLGICTDCLRFSTESSIPRTLILAAKTWRYGADYVNVHKRLYKRTWSDIRISNYLLDNCNKNGNVIWYFLTIDEIEKLDIKKTKGLVSTFNHIEEHWIWILFVETPDGLVKVDFRSTNVGVRDLATKYGGGGHEFASGALVEKDKIHEIVDDANELVENAKKNHVFTDFLDIEDVSAIERERKSLEASRVVSELLDEAKEFIKDDRENESEEDDERSEE